MAASAHPETPRLLFVHAHPDDETITTGATIAHYTARGARVQVVTCTLGEEGEVIGERYARLAVDSADQLGGYRIGELTAALAALGAEPPMFLGGAGRWRDSGMAGTPARRHQRFIDADQREAIGALVAIIRELRPHVVVTYDPRGGYGHPDHIHTHTLTTAAVTAAASEEHPGRPWWVPKLYWTVSAAATTRAGLKALTPQDLGRAGPTTRTPTPVSATPTSRSTRSSRTRTRWRRRSPPWVPTPPRCRSDPPGGRSRCRIGSRCRYSPLNTTFWSPERPGSATPAAGRPICWPEWTSPSRQRGNILPADNTQSTREGRGMDPDLDPNLERWQVRTDDFQWVVGSLVGLLDSIPT